MPFPFAETVRETPFPADERRAYRGNKVENDRKNK